MSRPARIKKRSLLRRFWLRLALRGRDKGAVAVAFILSLPILLVVIGVLVQLALLANARLTVERSLTAGARTAQTALPTNPYIDSRGGFQLVDRSIYMTLESISPAAKGATSLAGAQTVANSLEQLGYTLPDRYAERFMYAESASQITIQPIDINGQPISPAGNAMTYFAEHPNPRVRITIAYNFRLTVPGVNNFIGRTATIGGIEGRYTTITSSTDVQLSPGRQAPTDAGGNPR